MNQRNIKLTLCYDGSQYHGWQIQENADTVQQRIVDACQRILGEKVTVYGCSRTDTGVHANEYCCNFKSCTDRETKKILRGLNAVLPEDIAVKSCEEVESDFNSRFDTKCKQYIYKIWNAPYKNPFLNNKALHYPYKLDSEMLNIQCKDYIGTHDFSAFCSAGSEVKDKVRTIFDCSVEKEGELVVFKVTGDGFLYNMVRIMVGTLIDISRKKIPADSIEQIILSKNRSAAGYTAPAHGLYLNKIHY